MADTEALQDTLFKELKGRIKEEISPCRRLTALTLISLSYVTGGQHPRLCREPRGGGEADILLNGDELAAGKPYFSLGGAAWSSDHALLAYAFDDKGWELYTVKIRHLPTGKELPDEVHDMGGQPVWNADASAFYYTRVDEHRRPLQVFRHEICKSAEQDALIYQEPDAGFFTRVGQSQDKRYLFIAAGDHETSEIRFFDLAAPEKGLRLIAPRETNHDYQVEHHEGRLIILTNSAARRITSSWRRRSTRPAAKIGANSFRTSRAG